MIRVAYVGQLWAGGTCLERAKVLSNAGWEVAEFDVTGYLNAGGRIARGLQHRLLDGPSVRRFNHDLLNFIAVQPRLDVVWIDKGRWVFASTLVRIKEMTNALLVHYTPDPAFTVHTSRHFARSMAIYDLCITTKRYELDRYRNAGARQVLFTLQGVDDRFSVCPECSDIAGPNRQGIVFVGHRESHYERLLSNLANAKTDLKIWGPGWERVSRSGAALAGCIRGGPVWGVDYPRALASGCIGIGLLSKMYPDQFTTRTFEVPAAGAMLLAERTSEHLELFEEGIEAEFFSSVNELKEKTDFYLRNSAARVAIAQRGRSRTLANYTWQHVLAPAVRTVNELRAP